MFFDSSFATSMSIMALSSTEKADCGRLVLYGRVSNSIVAPLTDVRISLSEVIICQLLMDLVMQLALKLVHLLSKYSLRSRTKVGNSLTDFLMFSKDCIMSCRFGSWRKGFFSDPSLKKATCSLQACSVCHSSFVVGAYHDGNCTGARSVSRRFCLRLCLPNFASILGIAYLFCQVGPKEQIGTTARLICLGAKRMKFGFKGRFDLLSA